MDNKKHQLLILIAFLLILSLACACPLSGLFTKTAATALPEEVIVSENTVLPTDEKPEETPIPSTPSPEPGISQWAEAANASSQFGEDDFSIQQALGEPDALDCDDNPHAWGPAFDSSTGWIELYFTEPVFPTSVNLYESYWTDGVFDVSLIDVEGNLHSVYRGSPWAPETCPYTIQIGVTDQSIPVHGVRVTVDGAAMDAWWTQIDAVELWGTRIPADSPYSQVQPVRPSADAEDFTFNNRWSHYLPLYESLDPRYDFGSTFSMQWETVNAAGELHETDGSQLIEEPVLAEHIIHFLSADTQTEVILFLPLDLPPGKYLLQAYGTAADVKGLSSTMWVNTEFYQSENGILEIFESDEGTLTAKLLVFLAAKEDPSRDAVIMAFFNAMPLE